MVTINSEQAFQTVITTYDVTPGTYMELVDELTAAFDGFIRHRPGFVSGAIHGNDAQTRIANYTQWETREQFQETLRSTEMRKISLRLSQLSKSFEPVLYEVHAAFDAN